MNEFYKILPPSAIDNFSGYDKVVAQTHIDNWNCIIVDKEYEQPIDNEYDLEEIIPKLNTMNESKKTIRLSESELHNLIKESVRKVLKENTEYSVWDLLDEMKEYMSDYDILARLISRIGEDVAMDMLTDIKAIEIGDNDDTLTEGQG
jgi:hypothetical protein